MKKKQVAKIVGIIVIAWLRGRNNGFAGTSKMKVAVAAVGQGDVVRTIAVEGHIETEEEKAYYAKVTAPVSTFDLKAGDVVQKGDTLVTYDTQEYDRSLEQAQLQAKGSQGWLCRKCSTKQRK